jgi:type VI secretion system protein ImpA
MASIDFAALAAPVPGEDPCGPDLDAVGDPDYLNFMARADGLLPASYFSFDRATVDLDAEAKRITEFSRETKDLRLLVLLAKLAMLDKDLQGFAKTLAVVADLLEQHWEWVHPRADEGDYGFRAAVLQTLDDMAPVVFPLQHAPLARSRRFGPISLRSQLLASGELQPREGEEAMSAASLESATTDADLAEFRAARGALTAIVSALQRVSRVTIEKAGYESSVQFEKLPALTGRALAFVDSVIARRDPSAQKPPPVGDAASADAGRDAAPAAAAEGPAITSAAQAERHLDAAARYFLRAEPSSPAILLIRRAQQVVGKSFVEVMRLLAPGFVESVNFQIGSAHAFDLSLDSLAEASEADAAPEPAQESAQETVEEAAEVSSRQQALAALRAVEDYYRRAEPTSPVPLLTERARALAERDFISILSQVLPEASLKSTEADH